MDPAMTEIELVPCILGLLVFGVVGTVSFCRVVSSLFGRERQLLPGLIYLIFFGVSAFFFVVLLMAAQKGG